MIEEYIYKELINPVNLFKNHKEFMDFIDIPCEVKDLQCMLEICEKEELYDYCFEINKKIKNGR